MSFDSQRMKINDIQSPLTLLSMIIGQYKYVLCNTIFTNQFIIITRD